ncbi:hypothetical protein WANA31_0577 [Wolbachia endosymbiont of Drosophila ananassae]|nr:hypothetical protein WANA31_0577 [Wolbachia endosymbiont of Drosophila ananassae]RLT61898.1 hypothetical protein WANA34_0645 [Wolbachia endosymbiont of Drosophila ananassae]
MLYWSKKFANVDATAIKTMRKDTVLLVNKKVIKILQIA